MSSRRAASLANINKDTAYKCLAALTEKGFSLGAGQQCTKSLVIHLVNPSLQRTHFNTGGPLLKKNPRPILGPQLSQMKPTKWLFTPLAVPNQGSLIVYHRGRQGRTTLYPQSIALARPLAGASSSYAEPLLSIRKAILKNSPVAQRIGRVAKLLVRWGNTFQNLRKHRAVQMITISKIGFFKVVFRRLCPKLILKTQKENYD